MTKQFFMNAADTAKQPVRIDAVNHVPLRLVLTRAQIAVHRSA